MKHALFVLACLLLVTACGGGGSSPATTPPEGDEVVLLNGIFGACSNDDVGNALGYQELLLELFGGGAAAPDFQITGTSIIQASFSWALDLDGDQTNDLIGTTQFQNAAGNPTIPVTNVQDLLDALAGDLTALAAILTGAPAGTRIVTTYGGSPAQLPGTSVQGDVTIVLGTGGTLDSSSGSYSSETGGLCTSQIDWTDLDVSTVATGGRPSGVVDVEAASPSNSLDGTLTLDGDDTAVLEAAIDGGTPATYTLDLATGQIT